jgi:Txe/YoeB family toxin of Txe-Axe toxin-antitoxin module
MENNSHEKKISQSFNLSTFSPNELLNQNKNDNFENIYKNEKRKLNTRNIFEKNNILSNSFDTIQSIVRNLKENGDRKNEGIENKIFKIKIKNIDYMKKIFLKKKNFKIRNTINNNFINKFKIIDFSQKKMNDNNNEYSKNFLKPISGKNSFGKLPYLTNGINSKRISENKNENNISSNEKKII